MPRRAKFNVSDLHNVLSTKYRFMPSDIVRVTYRNNKELYDNVLKHASLRDKISCSVISLSSCQDNQLANDGPFNSAFISALLNVWKSGSFEGGYREFYKRILKRMPPGQSPNYTIIGMRDAKFEVDRPFTL